MHHRARRAAVSVAAVSAAVIVGTLTACADSEHKTEPRADASTSASADPSAEQAAATPESVSPELTHASLLAVNGAELQENGSALTSEQLEVSLQPIMKTDEENFTASEAMVSMFGEFNAFYNGGICDEEHFGFGINEESDATKVQRDQQLKVIYGDTIPENLAEAVHVQNETRATIAKLRFTDWTDGADPFINQVTGEVLSETQVAENVYHVTTHYTAASNLTELNPHVAEDSFASDVTMVYDLTLQPNGQWIITDAHPAN